MAKVDRNLQCVNDACCLRAHGNQRLLKFIGSPIQTIGGNGRSPHPA